MTRAAQPLALVGVTALIWLAAGAVLAELGLRPPRRLPAGNGSEVTVTAPDGVTLHGSLWQPEAASRGCILLLHGVADNRDGVAPHARLFLRHGFTVLSADIRAHGRSGGGLLTFGLRERYDVSRWVDLLLERCPHDVFGLGESLGAGILLQAVSVEPRIRAVIAECPYSSFWEVAVDRVAQRSALPPGPSRALAAALVASGFLHARWRFGLDLSHASPVESLRRANTPVLLIHGLEDTNTPPEHSRRLRAANAAVDSWFVPGAWHTGALLTAPREFEQRVLAFLDRHRAKPAEEVAGSPGRITRNGI